MTRMIDIDLYPSLPGNADRKTRLTVSTAHIVAVEVTTTVIGRRASVCLWLTSLPEVFGGRVEIEAFEASKDRDFEECVKLARAFADGIRVMMEVA